MAKEILLYNYHLSNYSVEALIGKLEEAISQDVNLRVNCFGGEVFAAIGLFAKVKEHGAVNIKVDGIAASGAGTLLLYAKSVECLSVSRVMLHRADAQAETEAQKNILQSVNADLRKQLEMKVSSEKFQSVTGYTIDQMFNPETRIDIWLNASQLKKLGIVSKIVNLTPEQEKEVSANLPTSESDPQFAMKIAAFWTPEASTKNENQNSNIMDLAELKQKYPTIYAEAVEVGRLIGVEQESERIGAAMVFAHIDAKGVQEIIKSKKPMSPTQQAEFLLKAATSPDLLKKIKADATGAIVTEAPLDEDEEAKKKKVEIDFFEKEVRASIGLDGNKDEKKVVLKTVTV